MAPQYSDSGSDSDGDDDEAPEEISLSTAKRGQKDQLKQQQLDLAKAAAEKKSKARAADQKLKQKAAEKKQHSRGAAIVGTDKKGKGKAKAVDGDPVVSSSDDDDGEGGAEKEEEEEEVAPKPTHTTFPSSATSTYLDPALFESAAQAYAPAQQALPGQGKMAAKRAAKEEKRLKWEREQQRLDKVGEGGRVDVGDVTLQHLPTPSLNPLSSSSSITPLPSHTSASRFLSQRLYSKKRILALVDASTSSVPQNERKRTKKGGKGKGMSEESKMLLGLGMDDGGKKVADEEEERLKRKDKKKHLLLQAEGRRKSATVARPLSSARSGARPASNFAVATRTK